MRDKQLGVPHIYGDTRAELMFGIGYATAEDRLFMIDVLRHAGQADLAQFAGGSNVAMDEGVWANEPYTHQDLVNQVNCDATHLRDGPQILEDAQNYVNGISAYISRARNPVNALTMMPAEYTALGQTPQPFTLEDLVSIATLVGGIFGKGGGDQLQNAVLYEGAEEAVRTGALRGSGLARGCSRRGAQEQEGSGQAQAPDAQAAGSFRLCDLPEPRRSWRRTSTVLGSIPRAPRSPGVNLYVELGHGPDYAWSATARARRPSNRPPNRPTPTRSIRNT